MEEGKIFSSLVISYEYISLDVLGYRKRNPEIDEAVAPKILLQRSDRRGGGGHPPHRIIIYDLSMNHPGLPRLSHRRLKKSGYLYHLMSRVSLCKTFKPSSC